MGLPGKKVHTIKGLIDRDRLTVKDIVSEDRTRARSQPNGSSMANWSGAMSPYRSLAARPRRRASGDGIMANTQAICDTFRVDLLNGTHAFGAQGANGTAPSPPRTCSRRRCSRFGDDQPLDDGLFLEPASWRDWQLHAGRRTVTNATAPANTGGTGIVAFWTPSASLSWANLTSSGAFDAMLLYNSSNTAGNAVAVFTFGSQSVTAGTFTLTMPTNDLTTGLIRIS
jgi:hypothetical protein